jgi:hypothetical protein
MDNSARFACKALGYKAPALQSRAGSVRRPVHGAAEPLIGRSVGFQMRCPFEAANGEDIRVRATPCLAELWPCAASP